MDNESVAPGSASELNQTISTLRQRAEGQLAAVRRTAAQEERAGIPIYSETVPDFETRWGRAIEDARYEEDVASRLASDIQRDMAPIQRRLEGRTGFGLTAAEWERAGQLGGLAASLVGQGSLGQAVAELRGAVTSSDRPRMAAFAIEADKRLRGASQEQRQDGQVSIVARQDASELRSLISDARGTCADRSLDGTRTAFGTLVGAVGDLAATVHRHRHARDQAAKVEAGEIVPFPPMRVGSDGVKRVVRADGIAR